MPEKTEGPRIWTGDRDREGHRQYKVKHRIRCRHTEGPALALQTPGLPLPGTPWLFQEDGDEWAYCTFESSATMAVGEGEANEFFDIEQVFSTRPIVALAARGWPGTGGSTPGGGSSPGNNQGSRCNDQHIENPLLEPVKITFNSTNYTEQGLKDRFDKPIRNGAHQLLTGPVNEWDAARSSFTVEQNWPTLEYDLCTSMEDRVNIDPIWGFPARAVKLSRFTAKLNLWGLCYYYFTRIFEFEVRVQVTEIPGTGGGPSVTTYTGGWDRDIPDVGTAVLNGKWGTGQIRKGGGSDKGKWILVPVGYNPDKSPIWPDCTKPSHFIVATDPSGTPMEFKLAGAPVGGSLAQYTTGLPADVKILKLDGSGFGGSYGTEIGPFPQRIMRVEKYLGGAFRTLGL